MASRMIYDSSDELALSVAHDFVDYLKTCRKERQLQGDVPRLNIAVAGGFVTNTVLPALAELADQFDWSTVRLFWVDERFVPAMHPDRNDADAFRSFLPFLPGIETHPMPVDSGQGLSVARRDYEEDWDMLMANTFLDAVVLGMGPDGHIASLFPHHADIEDTRRVAAIDHSPKPPPQRLSLTLPVLLQARKIWVCAAGETKAHAVAEAWMGAPVRDIPASAFATVAHAAWYLDEDAAALLPEGF